MLLCSRSVPEQLAEGRSPLNELPPPPRHLPLGATIRRISGGVRYQVSWLFLGLATTFLFVFALDLSSFLLSRGETGRVSGVLVDGQETVFSRTVVGRGAILHGQGDPIHRYTYRYVVDGETYGGSSFAGEGAFEAGAPAAVEYLVARPCVSRLEGMSAEIRLGGGVLPMAIPLAMILLAGSSVVIMTRKRLRQHDLMRRGVTAEGTAESTELLSRTYHGREWYQVTWEYSAHGRRCLLTDRPPLAERVAVGDRRRILFDPDDPDRAVLLRNASDLGMLDSHPGIIGALRNWGAALLPVGTTVALVLGLYSELSC